MLMDDELFDDDLELTERGADETGSPRAAIASQPIRDGSRTLLHDGYDVQLFHDAVGEYPKLAELIASARERLITTPALICDVFWSERCDEYIPLKLAQCLGCCRETQSSTPLENLKHPLSPRHIR
jgi:hypothetical protein